MKKDNNTRKFGEAPIFLQLSNAKLTDTDRVIALQLAQSFAEHFGLKQTREHLEPLSLAFSNGVSYARAWAQLSEEDKQKTIDYYKPLAEELFGKPDASLN